MDRSLSLKLVNVTTILDTASWIKSILRSFCKCLDLQACIYSIYPFFPYSMLSLGVCGSPGFVCTTWQHWHWNRGGEGGGGWKTDLWYLNEWKHRQDWSRHTTATWIKFLSIEGRFLTFTPPCWTVIPLFSCSLVIPMKTLRPNKTHNWNVHIRWPRQQKTLLLLKPK